MKKSLKKPKKVFSLVSDVKGYGGEGCGGGLCGFNW